MKKKNSISYIIIGLVILLAAAFVVIEFLIPGYSAKIDETSSDTVIVQAKGIKKNITIDIKKVIDKLLPDTPEAIKNVTVEGTDKNITLNLTDAYNVDISVSASETSIKGADKQVTIKSLYIDGDLIVGGQNLIVSNGLVLTNGTCDVIKDSYLICAGQVNGIVLDNASFVVNKGVVKAYSLDSYAVDMNGQSGFSLNAGKFTAVAGSNATKNIFGGDGASNVTIADDTRQYGDYKSESKTFLLTKDYDIVIVLDPGHGGDEYGTTAASDNYPAGGDEYLYYAEKTVNLKMAMAAKKELDKYAGIKVYLTRTEDIKMTLQERADIANEKKADYFISMHNNSIDDSSLRDVYEGAEVWQSVLPRYENREFCQSILNSIGEIGLKINRGVKAREDNGSTDGKPFYWDMLNNTNSADNEETSRYSDYYGVIKASARYYINGIIVEHMFLSNPVDVTYVDTDEKIDKFGISDAQAIVGYFKL